MKKKILILDTGKEQFGMVLIEAMACGKPVISTISGSIPEVVGDAGLLIPSGDFFELAETIYKLMLDNNLRDGLGKKGRERTEMLYDANKNSSRFKNVIEERL